MKTLFLTLPVWFCLAASAQTIVISNGAFAPVILNASSALPLNYPVRSAADELFPTASFVSSTNLFVTVPAGAYYFESYLSLHTTNNLQIFAQVFCSPNASKGSIYGEGYPFQSSPATSGLMLPTAGATLGTPGNVYVNNTYVVLRIFGYITTTNSTTITVQVESTGGGTATVLAGSWFTVHQ